MVSGAVTPLHPPLSAPPVSRRSRASVKVQVWLLIAMSLVLKRQLSRLFVNKEKKTKSTSNASFNCNLQLTTHIVWRTVTENCVDAHESKKERKSWRRWSNLTALGHPSGMSWPCLNGVDMSPVKAFTPEGLHGQLMQNCQCCHGCSRKCSLLLPQTAKLSVKSAHKM